MNSDLEVPALVEDCIVAAVDAVLDEYGKLPWNEAEYQDLRAEVRAKGANRAGTALGRAVVVAAAAGDVNQLLAKLRHGALAESIHDANLHLGRLVYPGFVSAYGIERLSDVERYVRGIEYRLSHLAGGAERDQQRVSEVGFLEQRYTSFVDRVTAAEMTTEIAEIRWMLEELRIQTFAQPVGTKGKVSSKKIQQRLAAVGA